MTVPPALSEEDTKTVIEGLAELKKESPRGATLIAAAILEEQLRRFLLAYMRNDDEKAVKDFLREGGGPVGTFMSRAKLAYLLRLFDVEVFTDFEIIAKVRNAAAHFTGATDSRPASRRRS